MNICFITNTIEKVGGVQRVLVTLANCLSEKHDVTILCEQSQDRMNIPYALSERVKLASVEIKEEHHISYLLSRFIRKLDAKGLIRGICLQKFGAYPPVIQKRYIAYFLKNKHDVIIGVQGRYSLLLSLIQERVEALCMGWFHNSYKAYFETKGKYYYYQKKMYQQQIPKLRSCVALTKKDAELFNKEIGNVFEYIYNPLTVGASGVSNLDNSQALFVGRIVYEQKGIDFLLDIAEKCAQINKNFKLVVVGGGEDQEKLKNDIYKRKLEFVVDYVGEKAAVGDYYKKADVVLNTSRWEGFGLVITEAMAYGVPVISFSTEGPLEIITSGQDGILIPNYDIDRYSSELVGLLCDRKKRMKMGENALKKAEFFGEQTIVEKWEHLMKRS